MTSANRLSRLVLNPVTVIAAILGCTAFLYRLEQAVGHMPFVMLSVLAIATVLFLFSLRICFSIYAALAMTTLIAIASVLKYRTKGFDLHIYDLVFTGTDAKALMFLTREFAVYIVPVLGLMFCTLIALSYVFVWERQRRMNVLLRSGPVAVTIALLPLSYPLEADEPRYFHYLGGFNASAFFISFLDVKDAVIEEGIAHRLSRMSAVEPFSPPAACETAGQKPDLFVVLSESQTDLSRLEQYGLDKEFSERFRSSDGKRRGLHVETFGGGTWISNFSLMTGLSSLEFGWRAPYLTTMMEGRVHQSLATELARCGYRTAVLMPMEHGFVNEGPFLESIGFDEILDYNRIGASEYAHRDRFYFEAARKFIDEHRKTDGRPLFLQVQTMFAHSPYAARLAAFETGGFTKSGDFELDEYVRRVIKSQEDFEWFLGQASADSKEHPSVVLEFGDHQSFATLEVLKHRYPDFAINKLGSSAYQTYFTVHGIGIEVDMRPFEFANLDIGYLGVSLLEAVGLTKSPMFSDLAALRDRCEGQLYFCADRAAVDLHLRKRIASRYLSVE